jgi:CHAT domain-containing protein/Flp pilus assembly protein TadD
MLHRPALIILLNFLTLTACIQTPEKSLLQAIKSNDFTNVKELVEAGADVNTADKNGATALMWAAYRDSLDMVKYLVDQGADYTQKGVIYLNEQKTTYYGNLTGIAAGENKLGLLKYLIEDLGINVDDKEYNPEENADTGWTAAQWADNFILGEIMAYLETQKPNLTFLTDTIRLEEYDLQKGLDFFDTRAYQSSAILLEKVLPNIQEKVGSYDTAIYLKVLNMIGLSYEYLEEYEKALPFFLEQDIIILKVAGKKSPLYKKSLDNLIDLFYSLGYYNEIESLLQEALQITEHMFGKEHLEYRNRLDALILFYFETGHYYKYEPLLKEAIQIIESKQGKMHPDYKRYLHALAEVKRLMGHYNEAELLYKEALRITERTQGKVHPDYGGILNGLAALHVDMGYYSEAELLYKKALQITKNSKGEGHNEYGIRLNNIAALYRLMGRFTEAELLYKEALQITERSLGKLHPNYVSILSNLATLYQFIKHYSKAVLIYGEALKIIESNQAKDNAYYERILNGLAYSLQSAGLYNDAEPLYKKALQIIESKQGKDHPSYRTRLSNLAILYQFMSRYNEAKLLYKEALRITERTQGKVHPDYGLILNNIALLYEFMGWYTKAESLYLQANEIIYHNLNQSFIGLSEEEKKQYLQTIEINFRNYHSFALRRKTENPAFTNLSYNNTLINKGMLLQSSIGMRQNIKQSGDSTMLQSYEQWLGYKNQLSRLYDLPIKERYISTDSLEKIANDLEKELNRGASAFREQSAALQVRWKNVQHALKTHEVSIEFISFRYRNDTAWTDSTLYAALVLRPEDQYPQMIKLCTQAQLDSLFINSNSTELAQSLYTSRGVDLVNQSVSRGQALYDLIWQPLDSLLSDVETVYFSPSGRLHQVAFAALPYGEDSLLMDRYQLHQLSSTRLLALDDAEDDQSNMSATLFGGIHYDTDTTELLAMASNGGFRSTTSTYVPEETLRNQELNYLPGTASEVNFIAEQFEQQAIPTELYTGSEALEEQFKQLGKDSPSPTILHIATHGFFFPDVKDTLRRNELVASLNEQQQVYRITDDPLRRAGLLMAGANHAWLGEKIPEGLDDGILTAYEVSQMNLSNTELVVLSACETGLGQIQGSEGVYGLQRAFKMAGAKNLIMSLWQVPDEETQEMMQLFYRFYLQEKLPIRDAFRNAQQQMREKYDPYYWAAFTLVE